jgi:hypothetical protein
MKQQKAAHHPRPQPLPLPLLQPLLLLPHLLVGQTSSP